MRFRGVKRDRCDVLVIGGGGAGIRAAIAAREAGADTLLVSKTRVGYSNNTFISKATIAATGFGPSNDGPHVHEKDTFEGGRLPERRPTWCGSWPNRSRRRSDFSRPAASFSRSKGKG